MGIRKDRLKKVLIWLLASMTMVVFIACGSSDDDDDDDDDVVTNVTISGYVMDGYGSDATVCIDTNDNGEIDADEPQTTTNATGFFFFSRNPSDPTGDILSEGGTDITTGNTLPPMTTPAPTQGADSTVVITPVSTLVNDRVKNLGEDTQTANNNVASALGLSDTFNLISYNFVEGTKSSDPTASQASVTLAAVASQITSLFNTANSMASTSLTQTASVEKTVAGTISSYVNALISGGSQVTDTLMNSQSVGGALDSVANAISSSQGANFNATTYSQTAANVALIIADTNTQVLQAVQSSTDPFAALTTIVAGSKTQNVVAQTAQEVITGSADSTALQNFTTTVIQEQIQTQASQVDQTTLAPDVSDNPTPATGSSGGTGD